MYAIIFSLPQKVLKSTGECVVIEGEIKGIVMTNTKKGKNRGYGAVLVWGGIVRGRRTPLVRIEGRLCVVDYITQVLDKHVVPFISNKKNKVDILMHDNAPPHRAGILPNNF